MFGVSWMSKGTVQRYLSTNNSSWIHKSQQHYMYISSMYGESSHHTHIYIHTMHIHTYIYTRTYIHTYIHTYIYTCTYVHTYIHTYIHTLLADGWVRKVLPACRDGKGTPSFIMICRRHGEKSGRRWTWNNMIYHTDVMVKPQLKCGTDLPYEICALSS